MTNSVNVSQSPSPAILLITQGASDQSGRGDKEGGCAWAQQPGPPHTDGNPLPVCTPRLPAVETNTEAMMCRDSPRGQPVGPLPSWKGQHLLKQTLFFPHTASASTGICGFIDGLIHCCDIPKSSSSNIGIHFPVNET